MKNFLVGIAALAVSSGVMAQEGYTVEGVAKVRENETARFYPDSVRESAGKHIFDVAIRYADPDDAPAGGMASRRVTYRADCTDKTLSVSIIRLRNARGQIFKTITVPPGGEDYIKPERHSREDDWLFRVCG